MDQYGTKFENFSTGKDSKEHHDFLNKKREKSLIRLSLKEMSLKELNDRAEELIAQYEKEPLKKIEIELGIIKEFLDVYLLD